MVPVLCQETCHSTGLGRVLSTRLLDGQLLTEADGFHG
jgi:hypothetical protein